jgi:hypothetical protein
MSSLYLVVGVGIVLWLMILLQQWVRKPFAAQGQSNNSIQHTIAKSIFCNESSLKNCVFLQLIADVAIHMHSILSYYELILFSRCHQSKSQSRSLCISS